MIGQIREMARRSILQTLRQPAMIVPPVVFPLLLVAINAAGLDAATMLPGFPADSYWDFALAVRSSRAGCSRPSTPGRRWRATSRRASSSASR